MFRHHNVVTMYGVVKDREPLKKDVLSLIVLKLIWSDFILSMNTFYWHSGCSTISNNFNSFFFFLASVLWNILILA